MVTALPISERALAAFCRARGIRRLAMFGSVLKGTARPGSDIDLLVEFESGRTPGLLGLADMNTRGRGDLDSDRMLLLAVIRALEVVGDAAARVSPEPRASLPGVPWQAIVGMRNRLIHGYFDVDTEVVWTATQVELPALIEELCSALGRAS